jgi:hypothetical protein
MASQIGEYWAVRPPVPMASRYRFVQGITHGLQGRDFSIEILEMAIGQGFAPPAAAATGSICGSTRGPPSRDSLAKALV